MRARKWEVFRRNVSRRSPDRSIRSSAASVAPATGGAMLFENR